jgi:hypothetical protein
MDNSFRYGLSLITGLLLLACSAFASALIVNSSILAFVLLGCGTAVTLFSSWQLRTELALLIRGQRGELVLMTIGLLALFAAIAWVSALFPARLDMTANREHSLAPQTIHMLKSVSKPVNITFFHRFPERKNYRSVL